MSEIDRKNAIEEMMMTDGWSYVERYINNEIKSLENLLLNGGFSNIQEYRVEQVRLQTYKNLLNKIDKWLSEKDNN